MRKQLTLIGVLLLLVFLIFGCSAAENKSSGKGAPQPPAENWSDESGISMEMFTNQPGVHVYTANYIGGKIGKGGVVHKPHDGICFETERFPNAINETSFLNCVLKPGEKYYHKTIFKLKTEN